MFSREKFAAHLRELRLAHNLSQPQLASQLGVAKQTINGWESGARMPSLEFLWLLADLYAVSLDYLVGRTDDPAGGIKE